MEIEYNLETEVTLLRMLMLFWAKKCQDTFKWENLEIVTGHLNVH
jgi:hypothetical protein